MHPDPGVGVKHNHPLARSERNVPRKAGLRLLVGSALLFHASIPPASLPQLVRTAWCQGQVIFLKTAKLEFSSSDVLFTG
jgi:hypothetical protein